MKTMKIKLLQEWDDRPVGDILEPAEHLARTLIDEGYAKELKGRAARETAIAPPAPENTMDALKPGRRRRKQDKR